MTFSMRVAGLLEKTRLVKMNVDGATGFVAYGLSELAGIDALVAWVGAGITGGAG